MSQNDIAGPGMAPTITNIDVTCSYDGYNCRMFGHLIVAQGRGSAPLSVSANCIPAQVTFYKLKARPLHSPQCNQPQTVHCRHHKSVTVPSFPRYLFCILGIGT